MSDETREKAMDALLDFRAYRVVVAETIDAITEHVRDGLTDGMDRRISSLSSDLGSVERYAVEQRQALATRLSTIEARLAEHLHDVRNERLMAEQDAEDERQVIGMRDKYGNKWTSESSSWWIAGKTGKPESPSTWDTLWPARSPHTPIYAEDEASEPDAPPPDSGLEVVGYQDKEGDWWRVRMMRALAGQVAQTKRREP